MTAMEESGCRVVLLATVEVSETKTRNEENVP